MKINGVKLDFRLYDSDQEERKKRYFAELNRVKEVVKEKWTGPEREQNERLCDTIKKVFDNVFGEGTGAAVCGAGNDLLAHLEAFDNLVEEQVLQNARFKSSLDKIQMLTARLEEM